MPFLPGASLGRQCHWPALYPTWRERPGRGLPFDGMDRVSRRLSEFSPHLLLSGPMPMDKSAQLSLRKKGSARIACISCSPWTRPSLPTAMSACYNASLPARETLPTAFYFGIISAVCPGGCFSWHGAGEPGQPGGSRSAMGLTEQELCLAVGQLRDALTRYFTI